MRRRVKWWPITLTSALIILIIALGCFLLYLKADICIPLNASKVIHSDEYRFYSRGSGYLVIQDSVLIPMGEIDYLVDEGLVQEANGGGYIFNRPPRHYLLCYGYHPAREDEIMGVTDYIYDSNSIYYPYVVYGDWDGNCHLRLERKWNCDWILVDQRPGFQKSTILAYVDVSLPNTVLLFHKENQFAGKLLQYPIIYYGKDKLDKEEIVKTNEGCLYKVPHSIFHWGTYLYRWKEDIYLKTWTKTRGGPPNTAEYRNQLDVAIMNANRIFDEFNVLEYR